MTSGLNRVPLDEILTKSEEKVTVLADQSYPNFGIYSFGRGLFEKPPIDGMATSAKTLYRARAGQFVYSRLFAFEGAYGVVPEDYDGWYVSSEFPLFDCDVERVDVRYLGWYFRQKRIWQEVARLTTGMGDRRRRVKPERLLAYRVLLPSIDDQIRIVRTLENYESLGTEVRRLQDDINAAVKRLSTSGASEILSRETVAVPRKRLRELVRIRGGGTPSKSTPEYWDGEIPWISPKDMKSREIHMSIDRISVAASQHTSAKIVQEGAVLVVVRGMILAKKVPFAILRVPASFNQDLKALIPVGTISAEFLSTVLWAWNDRLLEMVEKSTHDTRKLQTDRLLDFEIPVPEFRIQDRIVNRIFQLQNHLQKLTELRASVAAGVDAASVSTMRRALSSRF